MPERPEIPPALDAVVMRALQRDPEARYPSGHAMADELEAVLRETPGQGKVLQALLADLFGAEMNAGQQAVARLTPQSLEAVRRAERRQRMFATPRPPGRRPWAGRAIAAAAMAVALAAGAVLLGRGGERPPVVAAHPAGASQPATFAPLIRPLPAPAPEDRPPEPARAEEPIQPSVRPRSRAAGGPRRIERGLPIDPFARAIATRGGGP